MNQGTRPLIEDAWRLNVPDFCETIEQCWDKDPEGRLTASCVAERIKYCMKITSNVTDSGVGSDVDNKSSVDGDTADNNSINSDIAELIPSSVCACDVCQRV